VITLRAARDDQSGGRRPAQIPQLDTPQASKESHNSIHNVQYEILGLASKYGLNTVQNRKSMVKDAIWTCFKHEVHF